MRRIVLLVLVSLIVSACVGRPGPDATGEEIYLQLCSRCHGVALEGAIGPSLGAGSSSAARPDSFLEAAIVDGRGRMPSFRSTLSPDQVSRLIEYLRRQQG